MYAGKLIGAATVAGAVEPLGNRAGTKRKIRTGSRSVPQSLRLASRLRGTLVQSGECAAKCQAIGRSRGGVPKGDRPESPIARCARQFGKHIIGSGLGRCGNRGISAPGTTAPQVPDGYYNLGNALLYSNRASEAATAFKKAVELRPNFVEALTNLGYALRSSGETDESLRTFERAAAADPSRVDLLINLATGLKDTGRLRQAVETLRRAVQLAPQNSQVHSGLIFFLQYCETDPKVIGDELRLWNQRHARPLKSGFRRDTDASPDRRLRIGYVSPDLCDQPTGRMVASLVAEHDRGNFEMFCYSDVTPDRITRQLQSQCDGWCDARAPGRRRTRRKNLRRPDRHSRGPGRPRGKQSAPGICASPRRCRLRFSGIPEAPDWRRWIIG